MADYSRIRSLIDQYSKPPKAPKVTLGKPAPPTFGELSMFEKGIDLISRPVNAVASFADSVVKGRGNPFLEGVKGFAGQSRKTFGDVLHSAGFKKDLASSAMGFGLDVLLDPLTYVGVGPVRKAATVTVGGVARHLTAEGASKVGQLAKRASGAILERLPQMPEQKLLRTAEYASKQNREVRTLLKGRTAEQLRTPEAAKIIGHGLAAKPIRKAIEKSPELVAPNAIKFAGQPILKTETLAKFTAKPLGRALDAAEKLPGVGKVVAPVREFGRKAAGAARAIFSGKTGNAEFDYLKTGEREARHLMDIESGDFAKQKVAQIREITGYDKAAPLRKQEVDQEIRKFLEGVDQDRLITEPTEQAKAVEARVRELEQGIERLAEKVKPIEAKIGEKAAAVKAAEGDIERVPGAVLQEQNLPAVQKALKTEAAQAALKEKEAALQHLKQNDIIAQIHSSGSKIRFRDEFTAGRGSVLAGDITREIPHLVSKGGSDLDEWARRFNMGSEDEFAEAVLKASKERRKLADEIAGLKGTKKELKAVGLPRPIPKPPPTPEGTVRVHHGTPHEIKGEFSLGKVGTGEGAAAYGHGAYLAESKGVAKSYQEGLSKSLPPDMDEIREYYKRGNIVPVWGGHQRVIAFHETGSPYRGGWQVTVEDVEKVGDKWVTKPHKKGVPATETHSVEPSRGQFKEVVGREPKTREGKLYHFDIADTHKYLDWDKPISSQPEIVKKLLKLDINQTLTGGGVYEDLVERAMMEMGMTSGAAKKYVSDKLKSLGVPGIKYFDAMSRGAGSGSRNFVVFDERLMKKLHDEAVEGMPIKVPAEDIPTHLPPQGVEDIRVPEEHLAAASESHFKKQVDLKTAEAQKIVDDLKAELKKAEGSPRYAELRANLLIAEESLKQAKAHGEELAKRGEATRDVLVRERVDYVPSDPRIAKVGQSIRERFKMMLEREQKVNPLLKERARYMPHIMRPEIRDSFIDIVQHNPHAIMKSADLSTMSKHALQRSNEKGVVDVTINDLIRSGDIDVGRLKAELKKRGIEMDAFDESVFETDPVKAMLGRELAHNRAISAGQFIDEVLNSPAFNKGAVSVDALLRLRQMKGAARSGELIEGASPEVMRVQRLLDQHQGTHSVFIPSPDFIRQFKTPADQLAMRQGRNPSAVDLLKKVLEVDLEDYAAKVRAGELPAGAKGYILPNEIAEHLNKAHRFMFDDKRVGDFLKTFDKAQGWWKTFSTVVRPAFHIRNLISNLWQNHLAGVNDPQAYALAHAIQNEALRGKLAPIAGYTGEQIYRLAEANGVLKHGFIGSEIGEYLERSVNPSKNILSTSGPVARFGQKIGTAVEDNARLANFIDGLKKGMDPASAAMRVKKYLFDYADLSEVEKSLFRRLVPFYTWTRKSIPLALETLVTQPGKVAVLGKARAEMEKGLESLDHEYVADYINQAFGVPVHKNAKGEFEYFLLKGYIPTVDLAKLDYQEILGMLSPAVKAPIEAFLNVDFYRMKPIRRFPTEMVEFMGVPMPVNAAHLLRNIVFLSQLDREIFKEGASVGKGIASELSFRTQTQNPVDQMRRYVLASQMEMGEMKRLAERAREAGKDTAAEQYESRLALLKARRDDAKAKVLKLKPDAFKFGKPKATPKPASMPDFKKIRDKIERDMRVENILKQQRRKAQ